MRWIACLGISIILSLPATVSSSPQGRPPIVDQGNVSSIACGPSSLFNWLSHGGAPLRRVLTRISSGRTPPETVRHIIQTYGMKESATRKSVTRYGSHNGGVGSVNLMLMASELLADHLDAPPELRGEYLQRREEEPTRDHLKRIIGWFSRSLESGVPVLFYIRGYRRTTGRAAPGVLFGHHVVVTGVGPITGSRVRLTYVDPSGGIVGKAYLAVAEEDFTAPTYTYRMREGRALQTTEIRSDRALLEFRSPGYDARYSGGVVTAHFATFAETGAARRE